MGRSTPRPLVCSSTAMCALGACGGDDDVIDLGDDADDVVGSASDDGETGSSNGVGFGEFVSGAITVTGAEESFFAVDDPNLEFVNGAGCSDGSCQLVSARFGRRTALVIGRF